MPDRSVFVIQKHGASILHCDFRLEWEGALLPWVVPKGASTNPGIKRVSIRTEDHSLDYAGFEGVIPEGEYSAGTVLVWDGGPCRRLMAEKSASKSLAEDLKLCHPKFLGLRRD